jgi:lipopolysaccharide/colanic/teichoic acid biosynthesis glycosyltransferase
MPEPLSVAMVTGGLAGLAVKYVRPRYTILKDAFDAVAAFLLLIVAMPIMGVCGLIIKLSDPGGPVLFSQMRVGLSGRRFRMYKLRTMYVDAEKGTGAVWAAEGDPRVIPLCRFMRLSHLDELPQLYNILRGDMSLVGPRPERPEITRDLMMHIPNYVDRLEVKPGLTGLAQIENGYDSDIDSARRKVAWDLEYVRTRGWATDMKILGRTVLMITGKGAR